MYGRWRRSKLKMMAARSPSRRSAQAATITPTTEVAWNRFATGTTRWWPMTTRGLKLNTLCTLCTALWITCAGGFLRQLATRLGKHGQIRGMEPWLAAREKGYSYLGKHAAKSHDYRELPFLPLHRAGREDSRGFAAFATPG